MRKQSILGTGKIMSARPVSVLNALGKALQAWDTENQSLLTKNFILGSMLSAWDTVQTVLQKHVVCSRAGFPSQRGTGTAQRSTVRGNEEGCSGNW